MFTMNIHKKRTNIDQNTPPNTIRDYLSHLSLFKPNLIKPMYSDTCSVWRYVFSLLDLKNDGLAFLWIVNSVNGES